MTPTQTHTMRTLGTSAFFAATAVFASRQRFVPYFPGATRTSLLYAAALSGAGTLTSGIFLSDPESDQKRRICILASLLFSGLATHYRFKNVASFTTSLRFTAVQAAVFTATEMITAESIQKRIAQSRSQFLGNRASTQSVQTFVTPALFTLAALVASKQRFISYFPQASRSSLLCVAGLSSTGVMASGMLLTKQESDQRRRICIAVSLWLSSVATYHGFKKSIPLKAFMRFAVIEAVIVVATEVFTSGGPKFPTVQLKSSLNYAVLSVAFPLEKPPPPRVTMTFCVDTSGSMTQKNRETDVKKGIHGVLESALKVVQTIQGAEIKIAIVGFSDKATIICNPTHITNKTLQSLKTPIDEYTSTGGTDLYNGLIKAVEQVESMKSQATKHTLILLTDGEANMNTAHIQEVHQRLASADAQLFAVGIGEGHNKQILKTLAPEKAGFESSYIDTTLPGKNIVDAISSIYEQTLSTFGNVELRSSQLEAQEWSINGHASVKKDSYSVCHLTTTPGKTHEEWLIKIHGRALTSSLDLSPLTFQLVFKDPEGKRGIVYVPWKADTLIDPSILKKVPR